jgi:mono/diheme cytochrome c family protein
MNCSACHTRQIAVGGTEYRIDGGPALTDFQAFLTDLDGAVGRVLADDAAFAAFAAAVPGAGPGLRDQLAAWYRREHALISRALPTDDLWGLGRLDAVSMIFNRLTAMDLGPPPSYMIDDNVQPAIAPVRYPFLWNAARQDRTQWPGFAQNGNDLLALARNLGQVYGVFGIYRPRRQGNHVDFLTDNSTQWAGLDRLEALVKRIGPPAWPWPRTREQQRLAVLGQAIFERPNWQDGGCVSCHGIRSGVFRPILNRTWATPLCDTGTDTAQYSILNRTAQTGVLQGARLPFGQPVGAQAKAFDLLSISVIGSIVQHYLILSPYLYENSAVPLPPLAQQAVGTFAPPSARLCGDQSGPHQYESRVLQGVWATAPYLHNGSVPTLADLLRRPEDRPQSFFLGRNYSTELVGLARDQGASTRVRTTTGCGDRASGNSRCGHDFGTNLSDPEKLALLEYLKTL